MELLTHFESNVATEPSLSNWGLWQSLDGISDYRIRTLHFNQFNQKFSWEIEVRNNADSELHISIALTPNGEAPSVMAFSGNYIEPGQIRVFSPQFCSAGAGESVRVWWNNLRYSGDVPLVSSGLKILSGG